jgi:hypothetical protein
MKQQFIVGVLVGATAWAVGCGGGSSTTTPPAGQSQEAQTIPQAPPDPAQRLEEPPLGDLHGAPAPSAETRGELFDISRDLDQLSAGAGDAAQNLADDLEALGRRMAPPPQRSSIDAVVASLGKALQGKSLNPEQRVKLSVLLYSGLHANELTASDRTALAADVNATLKEAGATAEATAIAGQISRLGAGAVAGR